MNGNISLVFARYFWPKKSLNGMNPKSPNFEHTNFDISELRTLLSSPRAKLNELKHQKSRTFRTQVHSITKPNQNFGYFYTKNPGEKLNFFDTRLHHYLGGALLCQRHI